MRKIVYSPASRRKLKNLTNYLNTNFGKAIKDRVISGIYNSVKHIANHSQMGIPVKEKFDVETDYYMFFTNHHYVFYLPSDTKIEVVDIYHEKEDFMMKLFAIDITDQESVDYWGEE